MRGEKWMTQVGHYVDVEIRAAREVGPGVDDVRLFIIIVRRWTLPDPVETILVGELTCSST